MNEIRKSNEQEVDVINLSFKMEPILYLMYAARMLVGAVLLGVGIYVILKVPDGLITSIILFVFGGIVFVGALLKMIFRSIGVRQSKVTVSNRRIYGEYGLYITKRTFSYRLDEIDNVEVGNYLGSHTIVLNFQNGKGPQAAPQQVKYNNAPYGITGLGIFRLQCVENYQEAYDALTKMLLAVKNQYDVDVDINMEKVKAENRKANAMEEIAKNITTGAAAGSASKTNETSYIDEIKKLKELYDMGAITKEEFEQEKKEILDNNH